MLELPLHYPVTRPSFANLFHPVAEVNSIAMGERPSTVPGGEHGAESGETNSVMGAGGVGTGPDSTLSGSISVAVVDAETPGNVGTIARAMKNFGLSDLLLVDPPTLDPAGEAYGFAGRAREDVLPNATECTFEDLVDTYHTIACTAVTNEDSTKHVRYPALTPAELPDHLAGVEARTAIVFGRERVGLTNDELARLDAICSIPANPDYPSLNLGQAATVVLYELRSLTLAETQHPPDVHERAEEAAIERLHEQFSAYLGAVGHPEPKRAKAERLFRRLVGRSHPTPREARTLVGIFRRGTQRLETSNANEPQNRFGEGSGEYSSAEGEK